MNNLFQQDEVARVLERLDKLNIETKPLWGKMNVAQMLAHCNVTYELVFENFHKKPNFMVRFLLKLFVKNLVVNEVPFKKNTFTAPYFRVIEMKDFQIEKNRLIEYLNRTVELGEEYFEKKESFSFGPLTSVEWNNMFYKHLDHHLSQFGV
jgi:hypothetical protein